MPKDHEKKQASNQPTNNAALAGARKALNLVQDLGSDHILGALDGIRENSRALVQKRALGRAMLKRNAKRVSRFVSLQALVARGQSEQLTGKMSAEPCKGRTGRASRTPSRSAQGTKNVVSPCAKLNRREQKGSVNRRERATLPEDADKRVV